MPALPPGGAPSLIVVLSSFSVIACFEAGTGPSALTTVTDSAGIEIVETRWDPATLSEGWSVGATPLLSVGVAEGDEALQLFRVDGAARLSDGRIAVVNGGSRELRFYSSEGAHLASFGGPGDGPGELRLPTLLGRRADTLLVYDRLQRRLTLWDAGEGLLESRSLAALGLGLDGPVGIFADGTMVVELPSGRDPEPGIELGLSRERVTVQAIAPDGSVATSFGEHPGTGRFTRARAVTAEMRERFAEGLLARADDPEERVQTEALLAAIPFPAELPPFGSLEVDALGHLWASDYLGPGDAELGWSVFGPDGAMIGRLTVPGDWTVLEIGRDWILVGEGDELGVETVRLYELFRGAPPRTG